MSSHHTQISRTVDETDVAPHDELTRHEPGMLQVCTEGGAQDGEVCIRFKTRQLVFLMIRIRPRHKSQTASLRCLSVLIPHHQFRQILRPRGTIRNLLPWHRSLTEVSKYNHSTSIAPPSDQAEDQPIIESEGDGHSSQTKVSNTDHPGVACAATIQLPSVLQCPQCNCTLRLKLDLVHT